MALENDMPTENETSNRSVKDSIMDEIHLQIRKHGIYAIMIGILIMAISKLFEQNTQVMQDSAKLYHESSLAIEMVSNRLERVEINQDRTEVKVEKVFDAVNQLATRRTR